MHLLVRIFIVMSSLLVTGCYTFRYPELAAQYEQQKSALEVARFLEAQARKCWEVRVQPFWHSGIAVRSRRTIDNSFEVALHRVHQGMRPEPFMTIEIVPSGAGALLRIKEGDFSCSMVANKCWKLDLAPHVKDWLNGNEECRGDPVPFGL